MTTNDKPNHNSRGINMKFRKKPVVIDAHMIDEIGDVVKFWLIAEGLKEGNGFRRLDNGSFNITTLEGIMRGDVGDWIIKGVKGEFYPCKPDIFEATYEKVE
jgi:hypothetical protein